VGALVVERFRTRRPRAEGAAEGAAAAAISGH
jgi:hypothetical protein